MKRVYLESNGLSDWKTRLASPKHWKRGRSAFELAVSWEVAPSPRGLPLEIAALFDRSEFLQGAEVLFAVPEHKVTLEGQGFASQCDLWALLRSPNGLISLSVEAKAGEEFDLRIGDWLKAGTSPNSPANRRERLEGLCKTLGIAFDLAQIELLRYQLFHRTASALIEAKRCTAPRAVMLVQSFDEHRTGWKDFQEFAAHLGLHIPPNRISQPLQIGALTLNIGWANCKPASDSQVAGVESAGL